MTTQDFAHLEGLTEPEVEAALNGVAGQPTTPDRNPPQAENAEWLHVGAEVATMRSDHRSHGHAPTFAKVAKIGKRDVVLDDGQRFNISRLDRREGGDWGWTVRLLPADAPAVIEAVERHHYQQKVTRAKIAAEDWRFDKNGVQPADVILALAPLTGVEAEILALFERPSEMRPSPGQGIGGRG